MNKALSCVMVGFLLITFSCKPEVKVEEDNKIESYTEKTIDEIPIDDVEVVIIDGCEYIIYKNTPSNNPKVGFGFMAHKGNCKNPIHCYNKILQKKDSVQ
ncbi:MAG: hypothetical protein HC831_25165 [Chloroflexia bacterium]|nr:hypothetical protein [Chloroflexia bacterium]